MTITRTTTSGFDTPEQANAWAKKNGLLYWSVCPDDVDYYGNTLSWELYHNEIPI